MAAYKERKPVALVTTNDSPTLTADDSLLVPELAERGIEGIPAAWDDAAVDWGAFSLVVLRSCWNYHLQPAAFVRWLNGLRASKVSVLNSIDAVLENVDKVYLRRLSDAGVPIPPTHWLEAGSAVSLSEIMESHGWDEAVIKPRISASAHKTWRTSIAQARENEGRLREQCREADMLIQQFVSAVLKHGELSFMFFDGHFSHAVVKQAASGDFRVQTDFGGTRAPAAAAPHQIAQARRALSFVAPCAMYARVDGIVVDEELMIMEVEIIDPVLFLGCCDGAAAAFAQTIVRQSLGFNR